LQSARAFGVLAEPVIGPVAPILMSTFVFAGAAQFAALSVLAVGGGAGRHPNPGDPDR
jgi:predicted branched-subunit amino acid permease